MCGNPLRAGEPALPAIPAAPPAQHAPEPPPPFTAPIAPPTPLTQRPVTHTASYAPPLAINGFSILGLGNDSPAEGEDSRPAPEHPTNYEESHQERPYYGSNSFLVPSGNVEYLLEDDESGGRAHWRMYVSLALLAVAAGALVWHWQTNGYPWDAAAREREARRGTKVQIAEAAAPPSEPGTALPGKPSPSTASEAAPELTPAVQKTGDPVPQTVSEEASGPGSSAAPAEIATPAPGVPQERAPKNEAIAPVKKPAAALEPTSLPEPSAPRADPASLYTEGEKYLYGDGVQQDCERAQKDLRTSAAHSYPQAESLLGTMYASGHCLGRDLPAAYRWYARALRHDPGNTRISSDLEVLWSQMTVAERKAAQSSGQ
jgi:hypothetical protein